MTYILRKVQSVKLVNFFKSFHSARDKVLPCVGARRANSSERASNRRWAHERARHDAHRSFDTQRRGRWVILRDRIAASQPTERLGAISELTEIFANVKVSDNEAKLYDFLLVGRLTKVGLCPSDVFSVIMACW